MATKKKMVPFTKKDQNKFRTILQNTIKDYYEKCKKIKWGIATQKEHDFVNLVLSGGMVRVGWFDKPTGYVKEVDFSLIEAIQRVEERGSININIINEGVIDV